MAEVQHLQHLEQLQQLQVAVANGDKETAGDLVEQLCMLLTQKVSVYSEQQQRQRQLRVPDDQTLVRVSLESRGGPVGDQQLVVAMPTACSLSELRWRLQLDFGLPADRLRCRLGNRLLSDSDTLQALAQELATAELSLTVYLLPGNRLDANERQRLREAAQQVVAAEQAAAAEQEAAMMQQLKQQEAAAAAEDVELVEAAAAAPAAPAGWQCPVCTFVNQPQRPGCELCSADRPEEYRVPEEFQRMQKERDELMEQQFLMTLKENETKERQERRDLHLRLMQQALIPATKDFECPICITDIDAKDGVQLRECLHEVCRECLRDQALQCDRLPLQCPYEDCEQTVTEAEVAQLLTEEEMDKLRKVSLRQAEAVIPNTFHCVKPNCEAFVELAEEVNSFVCQVCGTHNCITCKASHKGQTCQQYQDDLKRNAANDQAAQESLKKLEEMVRQGEAMHCPHCRVYVQKREGCDWLQCSMCRTEICWATRGPRWGPKGKGDTSGGCKCRVNNRKCHPNCQNCH